MGCKLRCIVENRLGKKLHIFYQCFITRHIVSIYLEMRLKSINTPTFSLNIELITDISDILGLINQWEVLPTRVNNSAELAIL